MGWLLIMLPAPWAIQSVAQTDMPSGAASALTVNVVDGVSDLVRHIAQITDRRWLHGL